MTLRPKDVADCLALATLKSQKLTVPPGERISHVKRIRCHSGRGMEGTHGMLLLLPTSEWRWRRRCGLSKLQQQPAGGGTSNHCRWFHHLWSDLSADSVFVGLQRHEEDCLCYCVWKWWAISRRQRHEVVVNGCPRSRSTKRIVTTKMRKVFWQRAMVVCFWRRQEEETAALACVASAARKQNATWRHHWILKKRTWPFLGVP